MEGMERLVGVDDIPWLELAGGVTSGVGVVVVVGWKGRTGLGVGLVVDAEVLGVLVVVGELGWLVVSVGLGLVGEGLRDGLME